MYKECSKFEGKEKSLKIIKSLKNLLTMAKIHHNLVTMLESIKWQKIIPR